MDVKYEVIIYWSPEDAGFLAEVPERPGCMPVGRLTKRPYRTWR
jgi:predicted RNase H-like HicB family nuclease